MSDSYTDEFTGVTYPWAEEWEQRQPGETETERANRVGPAKFDHEFYLSFGRYPEESPLYDGPAPSPPPTAPGPSRPTVSSRRREAVQALIDRGATEGEREAARAAMYRLDHPSTVAHDATERGSYYARDTLGGNDA